MTKTLILTYAPALFCLASAVLAGVVARRKATLDIAITLACCSFATTIAYASLDSFSWQLMFEVLMAALIVQRALLTIKIDGAMRPVCGLIMVLAAIDVGFCSVVSVRLSAFPREINFYRSLVPWITNSIFLAQAALAAWPGIADGLAVHSGGRRGLSDRALDHSSLSRHQER